MFSLLCGCGRANETMPTGWHCVLWPQRSCKTSVPLPAYRGDWDSERVWEVPGVMEGVRPHARPVPGGQLGRSGSLFSVAIHWGCALSSITTKPSPKSLGLLCSLCDGDRDELLGCLEPWPAWLWPSSMGGCPWGFDSSLGSRKAGSVRGPGRRSPTWSLGPCAPFPAVIRWGAWAS